MIEKQSGYRAIIIITTWRTSNTSPFRRQQFSKGHLSIVSMVVKFYTMHLLWRENNVYTVRDEKQIWEEFTWDLGQSKSLWSFHTKCNLWKFTTMLKLSKGPLLNSCHVKRAMDQTLLSFQVALVARQCHCTAREDVQHGLSFHTKCNLWKFATMLKLSKGPMLMSCVRAYRWKIHYGPITILSVALVGRQCHCTARAESNLGYPFTRSATCSFLQPC